MFVVLSNAKMDVWRFPIEWLTWGCMHCDRANMGPNAVLQNNMCGITSLQIHIPIFAISTQISASNFSFRVKYCRPVARKLGNIFLLKNLFHPEARMVIG